MEIPKQVYSDLIMIEHRTYSGKSDHEGITSSFFGGGILYRLNFNVTSYSLVEQGILRVDQVGALENPMLRIPLTYQNLTKVSFEPIIWNIRNAFRFIAQLPGLTQVEFKLPKRNFVVPDFIAFDMDDEIERTEFVNQSVNKLWIGVDLACFASMTPEMKKRILVFLTNILNVSSICFPGLKKLCLELPGEKTHTMYIAVFELISKSPGLAKAIILTDMGNSRVSSDMNEFSWFKRATSFQITCTCDFYTGPIRAVQNGTIPQQTDPESIKKTGDSSLAACTSSSGSPKSPVRWRITILAV